MSRTGSQPPIVLVGASGLAREAVAAAHGSGRGVLGFLDDDPGLAGRTLVHGLAVLGSLDAVGAYPDAALVLCVGKGAGRARIAARLASAGIAEDRYATVVHPSVHLPDGVTVGAGSVLLAGVVLTADVRIGRHVVCMPNVVLTHDCCLDDYATVCAGVVLGGGVTVGRAAYLGMAASVRERLSVGAGSMVGMGSVVLADVPEGQTWAGVPARRLAP
ncbi:MAG: NeuD/PglB/VioB family sugar acetyltransferase [Actinomycetota bacterium]|nr:NeuD/PglB/VioB family sugar acetyltransferase [Actinomycetota bacterium]